VEYLDSKTVTVCASRFVAGKRLVGQRILVRLQRWTVIGVMRGGALLPMCKCNYDCLTTGNKSNHPN
jgi:hypothetical protein